MNLLFETKKVKISGSEYRIVLQNENGPCALIALINILLISNQHKNKVPELTKLVDEKRIIQLESLISVLANIAVQNSLDTQIQDVNQLLQLLPRLHTGLNINPKFDGSIKDTNEMSLFRLFNVHVVHGWLIDPYQNLNQYECVRHHSYDDAQKLLVQAYDIQQNNLNVQHKDQILQDANYLKSFLECTPAQLTDYGLGYLKTVLTEGSYAVLFRNDHFSTIHMKNGNLFILITDLGFKDCEDITWQSLESVNGSQDLFFTGDLVPIMLHNNVMKFDGSSNHRNHTADLNEYLILDQDTNFMTDEELAQHLQEKEDAYVAKEIQRNLNYKNNIKTASTSQKIKSNNKNKSHLPKKKSRFYSISVRSKKCVIM